jgi:hypothetical protein
VIVRNEQIEAMREAANLVFERKLIRELSVNMPDLVSQAPPAELQAFVHGALVRGRRHGITSQPGLAEFSALLLAIVGPSPAPGEPKWLRRILMNPKLDESAKVQHMRTRVAKAPGGGAA